MQEGHEQRRVEIRGLAELGLTELAKAAGGVARIHNSVSAGVFGTLRRTPLRQWTEPIRTAHDSIADAGYRSVAACLRVADDVAAGAIDQAVRSPAKKAPSQTPGGAIALAIVNGLIGDELAARNSPLQAAMSIRRDGVPVPPTRSGMAEAFSDATGHVVVFVHGLMETEYAWKRGGRPSYGQRLGDDIAATEVQIRYNTGHHISHNGAELCAVLDALIAFWPVPVTTLSLVGHSMGGLVIRSACHQATAQQRSWPNLVRHTASLGSPHLGAPLARGVHVAAAALRGFPVTQPLGNLLGRRSDGVRDLFHGALTDADWAGAQRDGYWQPGISETPLLANAQHLYATATLTRDPLNPLGRVVGDGLVLVSSGQGRTHARRVGFHDDDGLHLGGANHFTLLNHDAVYDWLRGRLAPRRALPSPSRAASPIGALG